jgi:hypothetical protein
VGFGIITEIDVKETLKKKLGASTHPERLQPGASRPNWQGAGDA